MGLAVHFVTQSFVAVKHVRFIEQIAVLLGVSSSEFDTRLFNIA